MIDSFRLCLNISASIHVLLECLIIIPVEATLYHHQGPIKMKLILFLNTLLMDFCRSSYSGSEKNWPRGFIGSCYRKLGLKSPLGGQIKSQR